MDPTYVPLTLKEENSFKEKQQHMYTILEKYLKIGFGKSLLKQYVTTCDTQTLYNALSTFALNYNLETITPSTAFYSNVTSIDNLKLNINETYNWTEKEEQQIIESVLFQDINVFETIIFEDDDQLPVVASCIVSGHK